MKFLRVEVVFDAADLTPESTFWARLLDGTVEARDDWHSVLVDGEPRIGVQLAPNHVAPDWPDGSPQQLHVDLYIEPGEIGAAHEQVVALGARLLKPADATMSSAGWQVYADPAGHPFCLCWG